MAKLVLKQLQGQLFTVIPLFFFNLFFFLLCDRLSNKYHNVHVTNKHQLLSPLLSQSLQCDNNPPRRGCPRVLFFSTCRCLLSIKYMVMASLSTNVRISSMENNQKATSVRADTRKVSFFFRFFDYWKKKWCQSETKASQTG